MRKLNFRKITSVLSCGLMAVSTIGFAAAASYPAPFVSGGSANVAIVYGTGSGVSSLDVIQAGNIQTNLQSYLGGGTSASTSTTSGGDSVKIEKSSTKFQLGKGVTDIVATAITDDSPGSGLPVLLADGKYVDSDNDEQDYTQKIDMANLTLAMFEDNDYKSDEPTVGIRIASAAHVLNYTVDFTDEPEWDDIDTTTIELMGKEYFVLSSTANTTINLLDSAQTTTLSEGETATVNGHEVSISFIGSSSVKLNVDGEITNSLAAAETQKLSGGDYVGIKEINVQDYAGGTKTVEFSVGTGKLVLKHDTDIEINDESISDMKTFITTTAADPATISSIVIEWKAEDDLFVTPDSEVLMPGFEAVKLTTTGMLYPTEEVVTVKHGGTTYMTLEDFPLKDSTEDIAILYGDSLNWTGIGKDATHKLRTNMSNVIVFDGDTDDYFVASFNDGTNAESYLMRATNFKTENSVNKTTIQYRKDGSWSDVKVEGKPDDVASIGNVELTLGTVEKTQKTVSITGGTSVNFHTLYSKEGLEVFLPYDSATAGSGYLNLTATPLHNIPTYDLIFCEEDKNGNIGDGGNITAQLGWNSASTKEAYVSDVGNESVTFDEILSTKVWRSFKYTALASELLWDKSGDQYEFQITYHGDEAFGEVYVTAPSTTVTAGSSGSTSSGTQLGEVLVKDTEVSSVSSKNLVIVGGSCINSAAATALGVSQGTCGSAFTTATGVGSGQFLIKGVSGAYSTGKIALVVAGYEAADTVNAAKYLTTQTVDTGKEYKGTSSTSATLVTTTA
ncbi:MAG: hypothetical protein PVJ67_01350 [Candidatus Pacearchaeota archaeon]|jgi:hypothetical protein